MKSLIWLFESLLADASLQCDTDSTRDVKYAARRAECEGESFFTITLPLISQALECGLEDGCWKTPSAFASDRKHGRRGSLPQFLRGFLLQVFDTQGRLRDAPSVDAILAVRQLSLFAKKVFKQPTPAREKAALRQYKATEEQLWRNNGDAKMATLADFRVISRILWSDLVAKLDRSIRSGELVPRHGPGATADRVSGNRKHSDLTWFQRWTVFPPDHYLFLNGGDWAENHPDLHEVSPSEEPPVRVVFVPKTQKTPRVIAMEPSRMQFLQQGLGRLMMRYIEDDKYLGGHINFRDQSVNRAMALEGSKTGRLATLDLSEASDRVDCQVVSALFSGAPLVRKAVFQLRSSRAHLPDDTVIRLRKFSSMGSALCFPVESMVFLTAIVQARAKFYGLSGRALTPQALRALLRDVYVYGDDLIVPVDEVSAVVETLTSLGMVVNTHKSFWNGKFRESCGGDYYDGEPVRPVYLRRDFPDSRRRATEVVSWVSTANQFYRAGWWKTARSIRQRIEELTGALPSAPEQEVGYLCWDSLAGTRSLDGWCTNLQTYVVRGIVLRPYKRKDPVNGYPALRKLLNQAPVSRRELDDEPRVLLDDSPDGDSFERPVGELPADFASETEESIHQLGDTSVYECESALRLDGPDRRPRAGNCSPPYGLAHPSLRAVRDPFRPRSAQNEEQALIRLLWWKDIRNTDEEHLLRSVRTGAVTLKRRAQSIW